MLFPDNHNDKKKLNPQEHITIIRECESSKTSPKEYC